MLESIKKFFMWSGKYISWKVEPKRIIKGALGEDIALLYELDGEYLISYTGIIPNNFNLNRRFYSLITEKRYWGDDTITITQNEKEYAFFVTKNKEKYLEEIKRIETEVAKVKTILSKIPEKYSFEEAYEYHYLDSNEKSMQYCIGWTLFWKTGGYFSIVLTPRQEVSKKNETYQWFLSFTNTDINEVFKE